MRKAWAWTKRNHTFVSVMTTAAVLTVPSSTYALKTLPGVFPEGIWNPRLAPYTVSALVFSLILKFVTEAYEATKKYVVPNVRRASFPRYFCALGMIWPGRIGPEVWDPAFEDEMARYYELKPRSDMRVLNFCFAVRMSWIILATILISMTDWRLIFLSRKKPD